MMAKAAKTHGVRKIRKLVNVVTRGYSKRWLPLSQFTYECGVDKFKNKYVAKVGNHKDTKLPYRYCGCVMP